MGLRPYNQSHLTFIRKHPSLTPSHNLIRKASPTMTTQSSFTMEEGTQHPSPGVIVHGEPCNIRNPTTQPAMPDRHRTAINNPTPGIKIPRSTPSAKHTLLSPFRLCCVVAMCALLARQTNSASSETLSTT